MSLDFVILSKNENPEREICLTVDDHFLLINLAEKLSLHNLFKIRDYYEDHIFSVLEANDLLNEIDLVKANIEKNDSLDQFLNKLIELVEESTKQNKEIHVIAD